jgi:hypothetical protein
MTRQVASPRRQRGFLLNPSRFSVAGGGGPPVFLQALALDGSFGTTQTYNFASTTAGSLLVLAVIVSAGALPVVSVTCSDGALALDSTGPNNEGDGSTLIYSRANVSFGITSISVVTTGAAVPDAYVFEISEAATSSHVDDVGNASGTGTAPAVALTTTADGDIVIAVIDNASNPTQTPAAGYLGLRSSGGFSLAIYSDDAGTAGAESATTTLSGSVTWGMAAASYRRADA